jgi:hypothetical protein
MMVGLVFLLVMSAAPGISSLGATPAAYQAGGAFQNALDKAVDQARKILVDVLGYVRRAIAEWFPRIVEILVMPVLACYS